MIPTGPSVTAKRSAEKSKTGQARLWTSIGQWAGNEIPHWSDPFFDGMWPTIHQLGMGQRRILGP